MFTGNLFSFSSLSFQTSPPKTEGFYSLLGGRHFFKSFSPSSISEANPPHFGSLYKNSGLRSLRKLSPTV